VTTHRTAGKTRDCRGCRYWSEMIAMSGPETGGVLKALCLSQHGPRKSTYVSSRTTCVAWASGHMGAVDEPGATGTEYDHEAAV